MKDSVKYGFLGIVGGMIGAILMLGVVTPSTEEHPAFISKSMHEYAVKYCEKKGYTQMYEEFNDDGVMISTSCAVPINDNYLAEEIDWGMFQ